jgi:putative nucleotidyltransferase with HDIG domain
MPVVADKVASELERIVLKRIQDGRLGLPGMAAAGRCMEILRDPDFSSAKLVEAIGSEPLLALRIVAEANSVALNTGARITALATAVARIGADRLRAIFIEHAAEKVFRSNDRKVNEANIKLWEHSIAVAVLARDIAIATNHTEADACYVAGLLHDIGKPVLAAMLLEIDQQTPEQKRWIDARLWDEVIERSHRKVGMAVATEWRMPAEVLSSIRESREYDASDPLGTPNVVRLANAVAKREGFTTYAASPDEIEAKVVAGSALVGAGAELLDELGATVRERFPKPLSAQ